ncbi:MAG: protein-L-isoaspartate O-methyltransferase [Gammaproteobacteria bacterium]|nr:protein-L-isoaspartate O-methyltransferase [Gammaproteobacteria bacterium]
MTEMNFEQARFNMIEQQIRPWEVLNQRVLDLLSEVPREDFVPPQYRNLALVDTSLPIGHDQFMMSPKLEARILQCVDVKPTDTVLEIGTGSGYLTALLAKLARKVFSIEIIPEFIKTAQVKLADHGFNNVSLEEGDAAKGWTLDAPYDVIVLTGSLPVLPDTFRDSLNIGGRLFAIVGDAPSMEGLLITRVGEHEWTTESVFETDIAPLTNATQPDRFEL